MTRESNTTWLEDADLVTAHVAGDPQAFTELVRRHREQMWAVALQTLHNPDEAAKALEDAFITAYRAMPSFRGESPVDTWLEHIVVNTCRVRRRRQPARTPAPLEPLPTGSVGTAQPAEVDTVTALLEQSSFGTHAARSLRGRTLPATAEKIFQRAKTLASDTRASDSRAVRLEVQAALAGLPDEQRPPKRPVRRSDKVSEAIVRDIVRRIGAEGMSPGTLLPPEAKMLEEYGVGRGSLREALRILEVHGLISIKSGPRGGPMVDQVHSENFGRMATLYFQTDGVTFHELIEARVIMEPMLARLAAQCRDPQLVADLARFNGNSSVADESYVRHADEFHQLVALMSGNRIMSLFGLSLTAILRDRLSAVLYPKSRRSAVLSVHGAIADAITCGDADLAERLMREHMAEYAAYVKRRHPSLMREVVDWR